MSEPPSNNNNAATTPTKLGGGAAAGGVERRGSSCSTYSTANATMEGAPPAIVPPADLSDSINVSSMVSVPDDETLPTVRDCPSLLDLMRRGMSCLDRLLACVVPFSSLNHAARVLHDGNIFVEVCTAILYRSVPSPPLSVFSFLFFFFRRSLICFFQSKALYSTDQHRTSCG